VKVELVMGAEETEFFNALKTKRDELIVPINVWKTHIQGNSQIKPESMPEFVITGAYVIAERSLFDALVKGLGHLFYAPKRLTKDQGGFWFVEKLEQKKKMPKHDIFDVGVRQEGSFRSKK